MTTYNFEHAQKEWSRPPLDNLGYTSSADMLRWDDDRLRRAIDQVETTRYTGWRNHNNLWREKLGLDTTTDKTILDFGCGAGIEALQFARAGNEVIVADIVKENVLLAHRVLALYGFDALVAPIYDAWPYVITDDVEIDVFYAAGVIHHIPYDRAVMRWAATIAPEARLMLYSDVGWHKWVGPSIPSGPACEDSRFDTFLRTFDEVGDYADFYSESRVTERFGDWWALIDFSYICDDGRYCTATLKRKGVPHRMDRAG